MISKRNIFFVLCFLSLNALVYFIRSAHVLGFMKTAKHVSINQDQQRTDEKTPDLKEQIWPTYSGRTDLRDVKSSKIKQDSKKKNYKIVLYHFYHNLLKGKARRVDMYKCNVNTNCEISHQNECSEKPIDADAVVYQGNHMPRDLPRRLNSEQAFVYLNIESPQYLQIARLTEDRFQYFFNWTMSYRFDSDIPYLYGSVVPRHLPTYVLHRHSELTGRRNSYQDFLNMTNQWPQKSNGIEGKDYEAIFQKKTKWSVWFVSHCRTASQRERYVIEMQKLTHVDIFGNCSLNTNICPKTQKNCSGDIQNVYKFVLAFENSLCEDYVTEKVFNRYGMDIITVVYGAQNYKEGLNCTPRAIDEFPENFFSVEDTKHGGIAAHIAISLYMFGALAIVCDDYFVSSLEVICEQLNLQEDVAGATFMAAGSSAPEFFTSVIGVFIAKSDVGVGTIVGSAVFNILFIIGACSIFAGMIIKLTWYPMTRDCVFYLIAIAALVIVIDDERVYWYEAMVFLILYLIYILIMYFNRFLEDKSIAGVQKILSKCQHKDPITQHHHHHHADPGVDEKQPLSENSRSAQSYSEEKESFGDSETRETPFSSGSYVDGNPHVNIDDKTIDSPFDIPGPIIGKIYWIVMLPLKVLMFVTIPDCRRPGTWRKLYMLTFALSIVWIAASSYVMVWMVTIIGDALEIPDTVMGLTILAAGTSVPDCLSSIFVARDGYGDMAVSNSIGSNVFDILICLGLPWLLDTTIVKKGDPLLINSGGIGYSALILLSTVAFMLVAINLAKWRLTKPFGGLCMFAYVAVISVSCLFELNVFGDFVLPTCDRET